MRRLIMLVCTFVVVTLALAPVAHGEDPPPRQRLPSDPEPPPDPPPYPIDPLTGLPIDPDPPPADNLRQKLILMIFWMLDVRLITPQQAWSLLVPLR